MAALQAAAYRQLHALGCAVGGHPGDFEGESVVEVSGHRPADHRDADEDVAVVGEPDRVLVSYGWPVVAVPVG